MKAIIFVFAILGAFYALEDVKTVVKRIDASVFGKTLLDTIYL
jgi:hypothetical protein